MKFKQLLGDATIKLMGNNQSFHRTPFNNSVILLIYWNLLVAYAGLFDACDFMNKLLLLTSISEF